MKAVATGWAAPESSGGDGATGRGPIVGRDRSRYAMWRSGAYVRGVHPEPGFVPRSAVFRRVAGPVSSAEHPVLGVAHPDECGNDSGDGGQDQQDSMWHGRAPYCSSLWLSTIGWVGRTIRPESSIRRYVGHAGDAYQAAMFILRGGGLQPHPHTSSRHAPDPAGSAQFRAEVVVCRRSPGRCGMFDVLESDPAAAMMLLLAAQTMPAVLLRVVAAALYNGSAGSELIVGIVQIPVQPLPLTSVGASPCGRSFSDGSAFHRPVRPRRPRSMASWAGGGR